MNEIHPTAIVADGASLGQNVKIGPYCTVSEQAELADGVVLDSHVVVEGRTKIGANTRIFPFAAIGTQPQDLKYAGEPSELVIGQDNIIREHVTMHPGTHGGGMVTKVGDGCLLMVGVHIAHDCLIGNNVIMANNATLGGHVVVEDYAMFGGMSACHQFCRIGQHAMIGGCSALENDVIPYGSVIGNRAHLGGLNIVGLRRRGFDRQNIHDLRAAYKLLFAEQGTLLERVAEVEAKFPDNSLVDDVVRFIRADSSRALCQPRPDRGG
jgi:UDP-N-acetylglucosamine acyltransferase